MTPTIKKIITNVNGKFGAPMGRCGEGTECQTAEKTVFDCFVPMSDSAYDVGGAYWGMGTPVRVAYTKDLTYIRFYRSWKRDNAEKN